MNIKEFVKILSFSPVVPHHHWTLGSVKTGKPVPIYNTIDQREDFLAVTPYIAVPYTELTYEKAEEILEYLKKHIVYNLSPATQKEIPLSGHDIKVAIEYTYPYEHCIIVPGEFNRPPHLAGLNDEFVFCLATMEYKLKPLNKKG